MIKAWLSDVQGESSSGLHPAYVKSLLFTGDSRENFALALRLLRVGGGKTSRDCPPEARSLLTIGLVLGSKDALGPSLLIAVKKFQAVLKNIAQTTQNCTHTNRALYIIN